MGCDIHFYVERFTSDDYDGPKNISEERESKLESLLDNSEKPERWVSVDKWVMEKDWDSDDENAKCWEISYNDKFYRGRNYYLFSILAGVRDYSDSIKMIDNPRGIPIDDSSGYLYQVKAMDGDGHSHSYFTLEELLNVNWNDYETENIRDFLKSLESMKSIDTDTSKVRCVFFFDN